MLAIGSKRKVSGSREKFKGSKERAERGIKRLLRAPGPSELNQVASGSASHGIQWRNRKVGSQVVSTDRQQRPGLLLLLQETTRLEVGV